jgi:hypothetical protein
MYRRLYLIGIGVYIVLLVFSIVFYKERIIILDTAFSVVHIIKDHSFFIPIYRFGDVLIQIFPFLALKAGLSLDHMMICYSAGVVLYYLVCYVVCGSILKRYDFALLVLLLNLLFATDTFYWMPSELPQGIALFAVILSLVGHEEMNTISRVKMGLLFIGLVTVAFYHLLLVFVIIFSIGYVATRKELFRDKKLLALIAFFFFATILLKAFFFRTPYEQHSMSGLKNFITLFPDYVTLYSNKKFFGYCLTKYYWIPLLFAGTTILYAANRQWQKMVWLICFFMGYLMLINISYPSKETPVFYIENLYLPLSIFLALPFVFDILPVLEKKKMASAVFVLIVLTGIVRIYFAHAKYTSRLDYERAYLDKYKEQKVIVKANEKDKDVLQMLWGTPCEMLLLSEIERHMPASIIIDDTPQYRYWAPYTKNALIVNWAVYPYSKLDPKYFHFTDTASGYAIIK